jgi:hypothetical protein
MDTPNKKAIAIKMSDHFFANQKINNSSADPFPRPCAIPYRCEYPDEQNPAAPGSLAHHTNVDQATPET